MSVDAAVMEVAPEATPNLEPSAPPEGAPNATTTTEAQPGNPTGDPSSPAEEPAGTDTSTEEQKSRSERRAEARRVAADAKAQADAETARVAEVRRHAEEIIAERDRLAAEKSERDAQATAARERYQKFLGSDDELAQLRAKAFEPVPDYSDPDFDVKRETINTAKARLAHLEEARGLAGTIQEDMRASARAEAWGNLAAEYDSGASLPDVDATAYRAAPNVSTALKVLRDSVAAARDAHWQTVVDDLKADLEIERSERTAAQAAAGGRGPQAVAGGTGGTPGVMSMAQYRSLSTEERLKLTPAQRDEITRNHLASRR